MRNYETSVYEYTNKKGLKVIKAVTQYAGKYVFATATLCPGDEYDYELGRMIAERRLDYKIAKKRAASMKRRAKMYAQAIEEYKTQIRVMEKEMEKALVAEGNRNAEAAELSGEIFALIHGV